MNKKEKNGFSRITLIFIVPFMILVIAFGIYNLFIIPEPEITGLDAFNFLPEEKTITLYGENVKSINIHAYQGGKEIELLSDSPGLREMRYDLNIKPSEINLENGKAIIIVRAKSGFLKKVEHEIRSVVDTIPPELQVIKAPSIINEGSSGVAVLRAREADSVYIKLDEMSFRAFEISSAIEKGSESVRKTRKSRKAIATKYFVFFPAPFRTNEGSVFYAIAEDTAGNQSVQSLYTKLVTKKFRNSSINIDDSFINRVVAPLLNESDVTDPVSAFRKVNEEWREKNHDYLIKIARKSGPQKLWEGKFLQMRNSKVMATYGDGRTYLYNGREISKSVHLGYDLASFANAPVEAANAGAVSFAGDLGIYGNTVVLDHGMGLMSLYGHLSVATVQEGQSVKKGEIIGRTGSTGLAGGDHLHFGILVHGYEVSPLYWWDSRWINVNIEDYLNY